MTHFPDLAPFDTLRTYAASGGHITTTWFATAAPLAEVSAWYEQRLGGYERQATGGWTKVETTNGLRRFHGVTVHLPDAPAAGPRPSRHVPPDTRTVVREDSGALPATVAAPAARPSLLHRIRARLVTLR